ncbi:MAG: hypothetical protein R6U91_08630 [Bacillota bacterium]
MVELFNKRVGRIAVLLTLFLIFITGFDLKVQGSGNPGDFYTGDKLKNNPSPYMQDSYANKTVKHFTEALFETGEIFEEHDISYRGGISKFEAVGLGQIQGSKKVQSVESLGQYSVNIHENYRAYTDPNAIEDEYMQAKSGFDVARARTHSAVVGTEPDPGETGYLSQLVASNVDQEGEYLKYRGSVDTSDGRSRMETAIGDSSSNVDVEGQSRVIEKAIIDTGGSRTGWWDVEWETDED